MIGREREQVPLLVRGNALLVLDLLLNVINGIGGLHLEGNGLTRQSFDEDLHTSTKTQDQVEGRLFLDVVVAEGAAILKLLSGENETLLVGGDALLVLNLGLHVVNRVRGLHVERDGLSGESFHENLQSDREKRVIRSMKGKCVS